jgi:penicillin-binding protein 1C
MMPPVKPGCRDVAESIEIVYPEHGSELFLPRGLSGVREHIVFSAAHSDRDAILLWYLDGNYLGETRGTHRMASMPSEGSHILTVTDNAGNRHAAAFTVKQ